MSLNYAGGVKKSYRSCMCVPEARRGAQDSVSGPSTGRNVGIEGRICHSQLHRFVENTKLYI
jgi:hypothetical protein